MSNFNNPPKKPTLAETNAAANNRANLEEAKDGRRFAGYDGKDHLPADGDYKAARADYTAKYLASHPTSTDQSGQAISGGAPKP